MPSKYLFILWFFILSVPSIYMMGSHSLSLKPSKEESLKTLVKNTTHNKWTKLHFLGADCGCSENIFKSLVSRSPDVNFNEQVFIIGKNDSWTKKLKEKGYDVQYGSMDDFGAKYSINAVPQLSVLDEKKQILYSGGYTSRRGPASAVEDQSIAAELKNKHKTAERPIFGCLSGSINRKNADPLGLKY